MMKQYRSISIVALLVVLSASGSFAASAGGTTPLFNFGAGGRALGMGGANVALANDASAIFWNPATLTNLHELSLSVMHLPLPEGTNYEFAAFGWPTVDYGTFSVGAFLLTTGDIERRDETGRLLGTFSANEQMYLLGYGKSINQFLSLGATVKMYGQSFDNSSAFGVGGDVGLELSLSERIALGFNAQNILAPEVRIDRDAERLPITFKAGAGFMIPLSQGRHILSLEADIDKTENVDPVFHVGGEIAFLNHYFLRAGYDVDQINLGAGLKFSIAQIGYTFRTQDYFDAQHRISLDVNFGGSVESILAERDEQRREAAIQLAREERDRELNFSMTQARYFYQNGMYDSAKVYYERVNILTGNADQEASERLSQIDTRRTQEITATVRAGVLAESDSLKAQELFSDLDDALSLKDLDAANVMLSRLRPAFGDDNRFKQGEAKYSVLSGDRISDLRVEANRLASDGRWTESAQRYSEILRFNPSDDAARSSLAQINTRINSLERLRSAMEAYNSGDTAQARGLFEQVLSMRPDDAVALNMLDRLQGRESTRAVPLSEIQQDEATWKVYLDGMKEFRGGNYQQAIDLWQQVLNRYPGNSETEKNIQQAKLRLQANGATN